MKRTSIQTLFGNAAALPGDLCLQVHLFGKVSRQRLVGSDLSRHAP